MSDGEAIALLFAFGGDPFEVAVDADTARRVETECSGTLGGWVTFHDAVGARHRYRVKYYAGCLTTTKESREALGAMHAAADHDHKRGERMFKSTLPFDEQESEE